uniref:Uncharacterized protein n=1 Tax=Megaselia scalaris TaxID=36166 RepID=T1GBT9_MEGSC
MDVYKTFLNDSKHFQYFEIFPSFKLISSSKFSKETMMNVKHFQLEMACNRHFPFTYCYELDQEVIGVGRMYHIVVGGYRGIPI